MLVLIRGAGDLASGVSLRLHRAGFPVVMTDLPKPTAIRRTVCFSQAIRFGTTMVEDAEGVCCHTAREVKAALDAEKIPVLQDETAKCKDWLHPDVLVDGILAKKNLGTKMSDAPLVIALGPGFCAGRDCHAVIETMRGHTLGRVIWDGEPLPNTNIPGLIGGFAGERVLRAPDTGVFHQLRDIGALVESRRNGRRGERPSDGLHDFGRPARDPPGRHAGHEGHEVRRRRPARQYPELLCRLR